MVRGRTFFLVVVLGRFNWNPRAPLRPPSDRIRKTPPKRITNKDRDRAVELYRSGLSLNATAKQLGLSRYVVRAAVDRAGLELRDRYDY